jgi:membrane protease YdiL (CAAX protease family)
MARPGETEHGSAAPNEEPMAAPQHPDAPDQSLRVAFPSPRSSSAPSDPPPPPPPSYPPPQYPPPQYPPGRYPPPQYPPGRYPPAPYPPPPCPPYPPADVTGGGRFFDRPGTPPATKGAAGIWFLLGVAGFAVGQVVGGIFVAIAAAIEGESGLVSKFATMAAPPEWYIGTSLVGLWVGFFLGPWVATRVRGTGRFLADLGVRFRPVDLLGIPVGLAGQIILDALYAPFVSHLKHFTAPTHKLVGSAHGWGFLVIAILTVCGAPFFEEILFRGLALKALLRLFAPSASPSPAVSVGPTTRRALAVVAAVAVDGVLFGLAHWELYQFAGLAVFGMLLATVSYKTGRLGMNMVAHATFNLVAVLAVLATSGVVVH